MARNLVVAAAVAAGLAAALPKVQGYSLAAMAAVAPIAVVGVAAAVAAWAGLGAVDPKLAAGLAAAAVGIAAAAAAAHRMRER